MQAISAEYATRRRQFKKAQLRWRVSNRARANYSLGWVPFKKSAIRYRNGQVHLAGVPLSLWDSYGLSHYELGAGNLSEDARGRCTPRLPTAGKASCTNSPRHWCESTVPSSSVM